MTIEARGDIEVEATIENDIMNACPKKDDYIRVNVHKELEPTVMAITSLSPASLELVTSLVSQLAAREGIDIGFGQSKRISKPEDGIPLWTAKLKQEGYSPNTERVYKSTLTRFLRELPTPSKLDVMQWLAKRLEEVSPARVATDRKALRSLFSFLREEGLWHVDPTASIKSIPVPRHSKEPPTSEEVLKLLEYECHGREQTKKYRTMTWLLSTTGLRLDEACGLKKANVLFRRHELRIFGKGNKEGIVPMLPITEQVLADWLDSRSHPDKNSPYVFPGGSASGYWSKSSYEKTLKRACRKFGLANFHPHTLRHFFATYALQHGAKLEVVSKILRHASVGTTADIYRYVLTEEMHETVRLTAPFSKDVPRLADPRVIEGEGRLLPETKEAAVEEVLKEQDERTNE